MTSYSTSKESDNHKVDKLTRFFSRIVNFRLFQERILSVSNPFFFSTLEVKFQSNSIFFPFRWVCFRTCVSAFAMQGTNSDWLGGGWLFMHEMNQSTNVSNTRDDPNRYSVSVFFFFLFEIAWRTLVSYFYLFFILDAPLDFCRLKIFQTPFIFFNVPSSWVCPAV